MKTLVKLSWVGFSVLLAGLTVAMTVRQPIDEDYQKAIVLANKALLQKKIARDEYMLVAIQKSFTVNREDVNSGGNWKVQFLSKKLLSKEGWVIGKGGGYVVTVNIKTNLTDIGGLE